MAIISTTLGAAGLVDVIPRIVYLNTNDNLSNILQPGYLNHEVANGFQFQPTDMACVTTQQFSGAPLVNYWLQVNRSGSNWSLVNDGSPLSATVSLTATEILGMYAAPPLLLAAPGAGKLILIDSMLWDVAYDSAQYAAGGAIAAQYGATIHGAGPAASGTLAAATLNAVAANSYLSNAGSSAVLNVAKTAAINTAIYLSNATAAFTTGNSPVTLYVKYNVVTPL